jgi:hypothetical protein
MTDKLNKTEQLFFRTDPLTAELIDLTAAEQGVNRSVYIEGAVQRRIQANMTRDGLGKSYYNVVRKMIADLKRGL